MNTTLYYRDSTSDKVYSCGIVPDGDLFMVHFAYGRRGSALTTGVKTQHPVSEAEAKKIYNKLVAEKMAKGYTPGEEGTPYADGSGERSGILPQLLNEVDEEDLHSLIANDEWTMQQKFDGRRMMIRKIGNKVEAINRKGLIVGAPQPIIDQAAQINHDCILDGEVIGDVLHVFDVLSIHNETRVYSERIWHLGWIAGMKMPNIQVVRSAIGTDRKNDMYVKLYDENAEGVVFKLLSSTYTPGRPSSGGTWLKYKFYATLSAVVGWINDDRRSVMVDLKDGDKWFHAGNVTIPPNKAIPEMFSVVEVRYLYATEAGILYQPVYLGPRTDIDPVACLRSQLKYKRGENEEE